MDIALLAVCALALRVAMAWSVPLASGSFDPNCAPDEKAHTVFVQALSRGRAPTWPEQTSSIYGAFVPVPYVAHACVLATVRHLGWRGLSPRFAPVERWADGYFAARLGGAILSALAALAIALAAAIWTGSRWAGVSVGLVAAAYPQLVFLGAYTNADAYTALAGVACVLSLARWARLGEGEAGAVAVGLAAALVLLGKPSGFFILPPAAAWMAWAAWRRPGGLRGMLRAGMVAALSAAPCLTWNAVRNGGDVLGLQRYHSFLVHFWRGKDGRALEGAAHRFWELLLPSAFGVFRNMNLLLPTWTYRIAAAMLAIGLVAAFAQLRRASGLTRRAALFISAAVALNLALVVYNCWFVDFSPQGRYGIVSALILFGVATWAPTTLASVPAWLRRAWPIGCAGFMVVAAIQSLLLVARHPCLP